MTIKIHIERKNEISLNLEEVIANVKKTLEADMFAVERTAKLNYLSGPRPDKLGVVTNVLRSGTKASVERLGNTIQGVLGFGPQAWYGRIHEEEIVGGRKRSFLAPSIEDHSANIEAHILKSIDDTLNRML